MKKILLLMSILSIVFVGHALADPGSTPAQDDSSDLINFMMTGQFVPAVGALLILLVGGLRASLGSKVPWFKTQVGGYVLAYGTALVLYVGAAAEQSQPITLKLLMMGAVAALTASGILDHFRDIQTSVGKKPPAIPPVAIVIALTVLVGCGPKIHQAEQTVIDCLKMDQGVITSVGSDCGLKSPDWPTVESCVVAKIPATGWQIGGCVIAGLAQEFLAKKGATDLKGATSAHDALEDYRKQYGHDATFRTAQGDL